MSLKADDQMGGLDDAVVVALGSNLKGSYRSVQALLEAALSAMKSEGLRIVVRSSWWRSAAWPDPSAPAYLNGVAIVETPFDAQGTLTALRCVEARFGRARTVRNAPRTLDLDLVAFGREAADAPGLTLPHPRAAERLFVMGPLAEIAPDWVHPTLGVSAQELAAAAEIGRDATPDPAPG
jgi:2-amino-4-hydroxy-6-hydroxymethyldihydropteridine diphosphokinase